MPRNQRKAIECSSLFTFFLTFMVAQSTKPVDIDTPIPVITINTVAGYTAKMECDLQSSRPDDSAYLVLWYIESEKQPIYSVDLRARPLEQAKHWKNERLASRAQFDTSAASSAAFMLSNVSEDDDGIYRCRVDFRHTPTRHVRYQLNVVQLPRAPVIYANSARQYGPVSGMYDEGTDLALICEVTGGAPNLIVGWFRNGKMVESRVEHRMHHDYFYHLQLRSLSRDDHRATYSCQLELDVTPPVPPVLRNITLNLRMKPKKVEIVSTGQYLEALKTQQLHCKATGANPPAVVTWWMNNIQLTSTELLVSSEANGTISKVNLTPAIEDDGRIVTCRAQTPLLAGGFVEDEWRMQVYYPPRANLVLGRRFTAEEIREGSNVYLECQTRSNPPIQRLTWMHNGKILGNSRNRENRDIILANQTLVIRQIERHTAGNYTCIAANRLGESASAPLHLHVKYAPVCRRSKPLTVVVSRDQPAKLRCQVEADPETLSFPWTLSNGRETTLLPREMSSDSGLTSVLVYTPRRDADFGELQCWALNDIGKQKEPCRFKIIKEGLPPTPSQCAMQSLSKGVLEVKCRNLSKGVAAKETEVDGVEVADNGSGDGSDNGSSSRDEDGGLDEYDEDVLVSGSSNVYWLQLYNADSGVLLRNMSNKASPHFNVSGIDPSTRVAAIVMTINRQGRSEAVTLEGAVERAVGSRAANEPESSVTMVVVLAAPGALLIAIIGLAAILAVYHRQRRRHLRQQPSQSAAQTCDGDDANDDVSNYTKTANGKPDVIKSKRGIDLECQLAGMSNESSHSSLVVAAGTSNNANGPCKFNEESAVTFAVQQTAMNDRNRDRILDPNATSSSNMTSNPHKPGSLRLHQQQHPADFTVRQAFDVRDQSNTSNVYVYR
ncbi:muscle M-line assembly protein unc-89-like [Daphnia pulicaria]|uniref:muscle M-line assembly protein unc-89-like n=1 Tax=Daphnia pulicaria TaxID=35523 RepID=UPI001EEBC991|nr:muscle M-line assembly protein unc-89-like [Daphnia pulicaria]